MTPESLAKHLTLWNKVHENLLHFQKTEAEETARTVSLRLATAEAISKLHDAGIDMDRWDHYVLDPTLATSSPQELSLIRRVLCKRLVHLSTQVVMDGDGEKPSHLLLHLKVDSVNLHIRFPRPLPPAGAKCQVRKQEQKYTSHVLVCEKAS